MSADTFPQLLEAVVDHLDRNELAFTLIGVSAGGMYLQVAPRHRCPIQSHSAVLAAWAKSMKGVTVKAVARGSSVHLDIDGYLGNGYHAQVTTVATKDEAARWSAELNLFDTKEHAFPLHLLYELADALEPAKAGS